MRVGFDKTVAREMFAAVAHAGLQQAVHQAFGQQGDDARVAAQGAVTNHTGLRRAGPPQAKRAPSGGSHRLRWRGGIILVVQVQHWGEAEVHPAAAQFGRQHITAGGGGIGSTQLVFDPQVAQRAHGRQVRETVGFAALHAPAFMVNADQQVAAQAFDGRAQRAELGPVLPVAGKQNNAADQRIFQALAVGFGQLGTGDVDDEGGVWGHEVFFNY